MEWNDHSRDVVEGSHAFLGASTYHWLNYTDEKLVESYKARIAMKRGTELHEFAAQCIRLKQQLRGSHKTLNMYVNDAIGFNLSPEVLLYYSDNCFGTADAIGFRKNFLRIHDLKTGVIPASFHQLEIYASLFCLEYRIKPEQLNGIELRIYQNDDILIGKPEPDDINPIISRIKHFDKILDQVKEEEGV